MDRRNQVLFYLARRGSKIKTLTFHILPWKSCLLLRFLKAIQLLKGIVIAAGHAKESLANYQKKSNSF